MYRFYNAGSDSYHMLLLVRLLVTKLIIQKLFLWVQDIVTNSRHSSHFPFTVQKTVTELVTPVYLICSWRYCEGRLLSVTALHTLCMCKLTLQ